MRRHRIDHLIQQGEEDSALVHPNHVNRSPDSPVVLVASSTRFDSLQFQCRYVIGVNQDGIRIAQSNLEEYSKDHRPGGGSVASPAVVAVVVAEAIIVVGSVQIYLDFELSWP